MPWTSRTLWHSRLTIPCCLSILLVALAWGTSGAAASSPSPKTDAKVARESKLVSLGAIDLPAYAPPQAFHEDLVITNEGKAMTMKRFVDHGQIRTEISSEGHDFIMIEAGDSKGTVYTLMPEEKKAMKQSVQGMAERAKSMPHKKSDAGDKAGAPPDLQVQDLGDETLDGIVVKKLRMVSGKDSGKDGDILGWFDKTTGAPVRMETMVKGGKSIIEWKNRKVEPQPTALFSVPKGYDVTDMDEMMKQMGAMGGMGSLGGMAKGMAGGMAQGMASNLGGSLGSTLGGSLGGPLGAMAGRFIGGKIGGKIGKKAVNAVN